VALAALFKLMKKGEISKKDRVVVISTANGLKFTDFKTNYHTKSLTGVESKYANQPVELAPKYDEVLDTILKKVEQTKN
jgi:threonine synthase